MKSGGSQKEKVKSEPWSGQQPYLSSLFGRAEGLYQNNPIRYFPGDTRAGLTTQSQQALQGTIARGREGSPLNDAAGGYITDVLNGKYLNQDAPGFQNVANRARAAADSTYSGLGRYGSGAHDTAVADSVGALAYQNYNDRLAQMAQAAGMAPTIANQDYIDLNARLGAGDRFQQERQGDINANIDRWNFNQQAPYNRLQSFQDFIQGNYGGTTATTAPGAPVWQQALGAGLGLAGAAGGLGWAPFA